MKSKISRIGIGRLYNLGSYEHVRYEITVDVADGESASRVLVGLERILSALKPTAAVSSETEIAHEERRLAHMRELLAKGEEAFRQEHTFFVGTPEEYIGRCQDSLIQNIKKREEWKERSRKARELLDDLGGAAEWKDAKQYWDDDDYDDDY